MDLKKIRFEAYNKCRRGVSEGHNCEFIPCMRRPSAKMKNKFTENRGIGDPIHQTVSLVCFR
jgi:hypothetical protein